MNKYKIRLDFIAMVYSGVVIVQPMSDHLRCCSPAGARAVTDLFKVNKKAGKK